MEFSRQEYWSRLPYTYFSRGSSRLNLVESKSESRSVLSNALWPHGLYSPWNSPGQNTRLGSLSLLQGIFSTQTSHQGFLHCRWILYQLSYQGSSAVLKTSVSICSRCRALLQSQWQKLEAGKLQVMAQIHCSLFEHGLWAKNDFWIFK